MATSMGLAEYESERHNEELIALVVADMQDPVTPILEAALIGEGLHDTCSMVVRLSEVVHYGTALIEEHLPRVGAVEKYLGHVRSPSNGTSSSEMSTPHVSPIGRRDGRK